MCIITGPADALHGVGGTAIFAGAADDGRQSLVYRMDLAAAAPVAMVLPLPVPPGSPEDAVRFVDLSGYSWFFDELEQAFPQSASGDLALRLMPEMATRSQPLVVHTVGSFEASFVPSRADFSRLDPRFVLPDAVWDQLPQYRDWGFAVFQFRDIRRRGWLGRLLGRRVPRLPVHPMALSFPRRDAGQLFFPTVHIHDGQVHASAPFDHVLYAQAPSVRTPGSEAWVESKGPLSSTVDLRRSQGVVSAEGLGWRRRISGTAPNEDTVLALG